MSDPDRDLARKARRGNRRALSRLYDRHRRKLLGYLCKLLGDREPAEDVLQEVWIKVMQGIAAYDPEVASFRAWLYRIANNAAIDRIRRERLRATGELDAPVHEDGTAGIDLVASSAPSPDRLGTSAELGRSIDHALVRLDRDQRTAVLLRHQQGWTYAEIAAATGVSEGTAKTRVHRGVLKLRSGLKEWTR